MNVKVICVQCSLNSKMIQRRLFKTIEDNPMNLSDVIIENIRLQSVLGKGGYAKVYKGKHILDDSVVAVKVLDSSKFASQSAAEDEFFNELQSAAALDHPRIIRVLDFGVTKMMAEGSLSERHWLAMELVEGGTLKDLKGRIQWADLQQIIVDILDGLAHAHARRLIHRDIKPQNILYDTNTKRIKIADFGLGRSVDFERDSAIVQEESILGTPHYMAPEQILRETLSFGPWTDLYAVGCMVWEIITGQVPYSGEIKEIFRKHLQGVLPELRPMFDVPIGVYQWLERLMKRSPNERFQHAAHAKYALLNLGQTVSRLRSALPVRIAFDEIDDMETEEFRESFHDGQGFATSTQIMTQPIQYASSKVAGFVPNGVVVPFPEDWQNQRESSVTLRGLGIKLFDVKSRTMIGREAIRSQIWRSLQTVCTEKRQQVVFLEGADGIGKKSFANWLSYRADELGLAQWITLSLDPNKNSIDNMGELLGASLRVHGLKYTHALERTQQIVQLLNMDLIKDPPKLLQLIGIVENTPSQNLDEVMDLPEQMALMLRYLTALALQRPLILVLNDIHFEPAVMQFIQRVLNMEQDVPLFVLASISQTQTDESTLETIQEWNSAGKVFKVELPALTKVELVHFIQSLLSLTPDVASRIEDICGGKPKIAVQIITEWIEQGALVSTADGYELREDIEVHIPESLLEIWSNRYQTLVLQWSPEDLLAFEIGAVLGTKISPKEWFAAAKVLNSRPCVPLMRILKKNNWIQIEKDTGVWSFIDSLFRDAVLQHLDATNRRAKICTAVLSILPMGHKNIQRRALLSYHAGDSANALVLLGEAILSSILSAELGQAKQLRRLRNRIVKSTIVEPKSRHALMTEAIDILLLPQQEKDAHLEERGEQLTQWAAEVKDWDTLIQLKKVIAIMLWENGQVAAAEGHFLDAVRIAKKSRSEHLITVLHKLSYLSKDSEQTIRYAREALTQSENIGSFSQIGSSYIYLAIGHQRKGDLTYALFYLEEAKHRFLHANSRSGLITAYNRKGGLYREMKQFRKAEQSFLLALETSQVYGDISANTLFMNINLIATYYQMNRYQETTKYIERIWGYVSPTLHPKLPKLAIVCVGLTMAPYQAWRGDWEALSKTLLELRMNLETIRYYDEEVYLLLDLTLHRCNDANKSELVQLLWNIQREQYLREGKTEKASEIQLFLQ